jgi:hypothetical protein
VGRAIYTYLQDLASGDPIAIGLTVLFLCLFTIPAVIWLIDLNRKRKEAERQAKRKQGVRKNTK